MSEHPSTLGNITARQAIAQAVRVLKDSEAACGNLPLMETMIEASGVWLHIAGAINELDRS